MSDIIPEEELIATPPITTASHPFDKANADIILRTSDRVDFHVYSQILIAASPFFEGMFDVPQPPPDQQQLKYGQPIIDVSETSKALDPLLRICYPINKPKKRSLEEVELSLAAAMKFEMELPTTVLTEDLTNFASSRPLEVWAIACRLRLESMAKCAAKNMSLAGLDFSVLGDMDRITAANYFRLREYFRLQRKTPKGFRFLSPVSLPQLSPAVSSTVFIQSHTDDPPPDVICHSTDGVDFLAHKTVLSLASSALIEKASPAVSPMEGSSCNEHVLPILQFEERSTVLHAVLRLSQPSPADVTLPTDLADLTAILVALEKYGLNSAQPTAWSFWQAIACEDPLRAYCYATRVGHTMATKEAARCALNHVIHGVYVEELECTPALAYHRLLTYYDKCRAATKEELTKIVGSLKPPARPAIAILRHPDTRNGMSWGPNGGLPAEKKLKKFREPSPADPAPDDAWLLRHLHALSFRVHERPGSAMTGLSDLFADATRAWIHGKMPRVWCEECQIVAEEILEVDNALRLLPDILDKVGDCALYAMAHNVHR